VLGTVVVGFVTKNLLASGDNTVGLRGSPIEVNELIGHLLARFVINWLCSAKSKIHAVPDSLLTSGTAAVLIALAKAPSEGHTLVSVLGGKAHIID